MKKFFVAMAGGFIALALAVPHSYASEVDTLLQKLVEKGILNASEAQEIRTETNEAIAKTDKQKEEDYKKLAKDNMPDWVKNIKLSGDFRARYQLDHAKPADVTGATSDRNRGRLRLRLGLESKVNDKLMVGLGIATGTSDVTSADAARSTNQSFSNAFSKKPLVLDYAYAKYTPLSWVSFTAGKMRYLPWRPTDVMIDNDITPEGGVLQLSKKFNPKLNLFLDNSFLVLSETEPGTHNAVAYVTQGGLEYQLANTISLKSAVSYYDFSNVKGRALDGSTGTNTKMLGTGNTNALGIGTTGFNMYSFRDVTPAVELGIKNPFRAIADATGLSVLDIEKMSFFGEFYDNLAAPAKNTGFVAGLTFGHEKIDKWAKWQISWAYSMLEKDAIPDTLPDSDRLGGKTGNRGNKVSLQYGLGKNTWLQFTAFRMENINQVSTANRKAPTTVFQADWNMKF